MNTSTTVQAKLSLLPFLVFVLLFLGTGLYLQSQGVDYAFYQLPGPVAIIPALMLAIWLYPAPLQQALDILVKGAGNSNIITMCLIYLLAGAFGAVAQATGSVEAMVNAGLSLVPAAWLLPGLFVLSALVSTAMGTSMGTIGALAPIAAGLATQGGLNPALTAGVLLSGAMFGDNLSIISDTTIAATRTQGAEMKDKFKENLRVSLPAAVLTFGVFMWLGESNAVVNVGNFDWTAAIPYAAILLLAVVGLNVFVVLLLGILLAALQGVWFADYAIANFGKDIFKGFASMQEIFLLSMFVGALGEFVKQQGGLVWIASGIQTLATRLALLGNKAEQLAIAALVFISNLCIANNTVAIVIAGDISKDIAQQHAISPKRSASLLDIFACISQGLVPYGAQALLLGATFGLSPWDVVTNSYYCMILAVVGIVVILKSRVSQQGVNP